MSKSYVIQWKSMLNGRTGRGTKLFDWEQAQELAQELNEEYPDIQHEPVEADLTREATAGIEPGEPVELGEPTAETQAGSESPDVVHEPDHVLSFQ